MSSEVYQKNDQATATSMTSPLARCLRRSGHRLFATSSARIPGARWSGSVRLSRLRGRSPHSPSAATWGGTSKAALPTISPRGDFASAATACCHETGIKADQNASRGSNSAWDWLVLPVPYALDECLAKAPDRDVHEKFCRCRLCGVNADRNRIRTNAVPQRPGARPFGI